MVRPLFLSLLVATAAFVQAQTVIFTDDFSPITGWDRYGVVMAKSEAWESSLMQDPAILVNVGTGPKFKMFYGSLRGVGYAWSEDGYKWTKKLDPILSPSLPQEERALNQPSVVLKDGVWHMSYFGVDGSDVGRVLYARANAPEGPWTKGGILLQATEAWEDNYIYNSAMIFDPQANIYKMWYTAGRIASAGGEPEFICYATASNPAGPWTKSASNPLIRPMNDGGWASLGVGGPNIRKLNSTSYELVILGWQAGRPSRAGRLFSTDGINWTMNRAAMTLDLGVVGGVEDDMIYRLFLVDVDGETRAYYNTKNARTEEWIETVNLAIWRPNLNIIDPSKWTMTQGWDDPTGASFEVRSGRAYSMGNARPASRPQTLQGNRVINSPNYAFSASITPMEHVAIDRDNVLFARMTDRQNYYYAGVASWNSKYAIGKLVNGQNARLVSTGALTDIKAGWTYNLKFVVQGSNLILYDGGVEVLRTTDSQLNPGSSYVGLQTTKGTGHAAFDNVRVELV